MNTDARRAENGGASGRANGVGAPGEEGEAQKAGRLRPHADGGEGRRHWTPLRIGFVGVAVFPLALFLLLGGLRLYRQRVIAQKVRAIEAEGLPMTPEALNAWYETPQGKNAAEIVLEASAAFRQIDSDAPEWEELPVVGRADLPPLGAPLPPAMRETIRRYLALQEDARAILHTLPADPQARYPINLRQGMGTTLPHLSPLRKLARLLELEGILAAETGDADAAVGAVASGWRLARTLESEPIHISCLVGMAVGAVMLETVERAVNRRTLDEAALRRLQASVTRPVSQTAFLRALAGERACAYDILRTLPGKLPLWGGALPGVPAPYLRFYLLCGGQEKEILRLLDQFESLFACLRLPPPERARAVRRARRERKGRQSAGFRGLRWLTPDLAGMLTGSLDQSLVADIRSLAKRRAARAGCAAERYRLKHGTWPPTLEALTPGYLDAVPTDPWDGEPLKYRTTERGVRIYSVGEDGEDNEAVTAGEVGYGTPHDDVFRLERPPSAEEIRAEEEAAEARRRRRRGER